MIIEQGNNLPRVKKSNQAAIRRLVYHYGPISRGELASRLDLTMPTITKNVSTMIDNGIFMELDDLTSGKSLGRKVKLLNVIETARYFIGVEMRGTLRCVCVTDYRGHIIWSKLDDEPCHDYDENVKICCKMVKQAIEECGVPEEKIFGIGVCLPGVVDSETGILRSHPGYAWERKNVAGDFAKCLGTKLNISVENNACARAYAAQLFGGDILNGVSSFAYMFVSTGIACPIIFNCFQDYGVMIGAGEAGHMVMDPEGPVCACGNRGCLEAYASDRAVIERCNDIMRMGEAPILKSLTGGKIPTMDAILQAQMDGEKTVDLIINTAVTNIAIATANIDNMARPDIIMFDAVMFENSVNRERFLKCVNQHLYTETHANTRFEFVAPNIFSGASGGAAIAIRADFESELD